MADKLLVRAYNVELGDCIYCRIPKARKAGSTLDDFHILIDCGSFGGMAPLAAALSRVKRLLPDAGGRKKRLDLLVATHEHKDHIAGFDPELFADIRIENIWMSAAMDPEHPQAERAFRLHGLATTAMRNIASLNLELSPELENLVALYGIDNDGAVEALRTTLPERSHIEPKYVHAGMTAAQLGLHLDGAAISVLGPERDIDHFYLGEDADETLQGLIAEGAAFRAQPLKPMTEVPANISQSNFKLLQSRMMSSAFGFAELSSKVTNNTSVVLLIEWQGRRLLFGGDAEWKSSFQEGKANGAWNVMWHTRRAKLQDPIDFLKVAHHGSENATPWNDQDGGPATEAGTILDAILPLPHGNARPTARAIVSTMRKNHKSIPRAALLVELGRRVQNARNYLEALGPGVSSLPWFKELEEAWLAEPQPWRTDCEHALTGADHVDVEIEAGRPQSHRWRSSSSARAQPGRAATLR